MKVFNVGRSKVARFRATTDGTNVVGLLRHLDDVAPDNWLQCNEHYLVELHTVGEDVEGPDPMGCAFVTVDGSSAHVVGFLTPALRRDYRVRAMEVAIRELFPHLPITT